MAKRKRSTEDLPSEELQRRKLQRDLQKLAIQVRTQGQAYKPQKHKRKVAKAHLKETDPMAAKKMRTKKEKKSKHDTPKWRPYDTPDVVVLPIYWNMHHEEKDGVLKAAERVAGLLQEAGIRNQIDSANQYTPGQKMKYWETAGVKLRVELGPKEAQSDTAVIARAGEPGSVAEKTSVNVTTQLVSQLKAALQKLGVRGNGEDLSKADMRVNESLCAVQTGDAHMDDMQNDDTDDRHEEAEAASPQRGHQEDGGTTDEDDEDDEDVRGTRRDGAAAAAAAEDGGGGADISVASVQLLGAAEAAVNRKGSLSNRERKQLKRERKRASQLEARREMTGCNVQEGSRRDKKRNTKAALAARVSEVAAGFADDEEDAREHVTTTATATAPELDACIGTGSKDSAAATLRRKKRDAQGADARDTDAQPASEATEDKHDVVGGVVRAQLATTDKHAITTGASLEEAPIIAVSMKSLTFQNGQHAEEAEGDELVITSDGVLTGPGTETTTTWSRKRHASHKGYDGPEDGGDDLRDDFNIDAAFLPTAEEDALTMTKQQRLKRAKKLEKEEKRKSKFAGGVRAWDAKAQAGVDAVHREDVQKQGPKKGNKAKVVVF